VIAKGFCLLVVAKAPVPGEVKTRLCPPATAEQAAEIAAASLLDTLDTVLAVPNALPVVALTGDVSQAARSTELELLLRRTTVLPQRGEDFAQRLVNAHLDTARLRPRRAVLQIGMDTPQVTPDLLSGQAERLLLGADALLGPAYDGGWWVLGLREPVTARALAIVAMSRPDTGELTRHALRSAGLRVVKGPKLSDVDTMADAGSVANTMRDGRFVEAVAAVHLGARPL
jgi:glycosyltransferase A (GT-A) superfamily protein (DUF2064 family)